MTDKRVFRAFFSYAHQDASADPDLVRLLTEQLQIRTQLRLVNGTFEIWRDDEGLRAGDRWKPKLKEVIRNSDILIVLLTPSWLGSDDCRREYEIFEEAEAERSQDSYVAGYIMPILFREVERTQSTLTSEQRDLYDRLAGRQYRRALATGFRALSPADQSVFIEEIADDLEGMLLRSSLPAKHVRSEPHPPRRPYRRTEFESRPYNYEEVDFVSNSEVVLDARAGREPAVYAQVDFVERLYLQSSRGMIVFGVQRAFLSLQSDVAGAVSKVPELHVGASRSYVSYKTRQDALDAVSVCMEPAPGKLSLAELALPPGANENYLSKIATVTPGTAVEQLEAELIISINAEGLHFPGESDRVPSRQTASKIKAIMNAAMSKVESRRHESLGRDGQFRRKLTIRER
jgi:hypothetical protein